MCKNGRIWRWVDHTVGHSTLTGLVAIIVIVIVIIILYLYFVARQGAICFTTKDGLTITLYSDDEMRVNIFPVRMNFHTSVMQPAAKHTN